MKTFSFAHLNPFGRSKAAEGETQAGTDTTPKAGTGDDADQKDKGKDKPKDGEEGDAAATGEDGDKNAGSQQAAAPSERERCAAIFAAPAAAGRVQLAAHLAFNTDLTVEQACAALEAAPIGATAPGASTPTGNPLALAAMDAHPNPTVGASTDTGTMSDDEKAAAAVLSSMAAVGLIPKKDGK
ncbi:hypothetical protein FZ983_16040 [Azospirillum sp. B21]|uniref:hypothetical protein n=1 Tax=Azospirillum sp. B21 TaxID=2607496 RepID=UPI0011EE6882|nr:hypothetical protein [Azospirillum sp. B21]KAA0578856.1 hypothetical protein FZ983_16040 [Azospirillum sp. B21]